MSYVILYPSGHFRWNPNMKRQMKNKAGKNHRLTHSDYYTYLLSIQKDIFSSFLHAGKLTQQYIVDAYAKMEANRLEWFRWHQNDIRAELYDGLYDYVTFDATENEHAVGKRVILPSSFSGSARAMAQKYQDAMSIVTEEGPPDLFITFTANPNWPEIKENMDSYETPPDRPDIVARVFNAKNKALRDDILKSNIFGEAKGCVDVVETQKRGLPYNHGLNFLKDEYKIRTAEQVDKIVCAELPDSEREPELYSIVTKFMIHGPCGPGFNSESPCMKNGRCSKGYPKEFCEETIVLDDNFPKYRRRNNGCKYEIRKANGSVKYVVDNRWVVPYNKYLTKKYNAHINVEICATVHSVKYLFLYIHKGHDASTIGLTVENRNDEILTYLNTRFVSPIEAF